MQKPNPRGFTLIELLIVIVLIGIMASMTMLTIGNGNQRDWQRQETERLFQLMQWADQEAMVRGMPLGLQLHVHGYRFLTLNKNRWQPETGDTLLKPRLLQSPLALKLILNGQTVSLHDNEFALPEPQLVFTPEGDLSAFRIDVYLPDNHEIHALAYTPATGLTRLSQ